MGCWQYNICFTYTLSQQLCNHQVYQGSWYSMPVAAQRDVQIVPEKTGQGNVPSPLEFYDAGRTIRREKLTGSVIPNKRARPIPRSRMRLSRSRDCANCSIISAWAQWARQSAVGKSKQKERSEPGCIQWPGHDRHQPARQSVGR